MPVQETPKKPEDRPAPHTSITITAGMLPWGAAFFGSYVLHSAVVSFAAYHSLCIVCSSVFTAKYGPRSARTFHHRHWLILASACVGVCMATYALTGFFGLLTDPAKVEQGLRGQHIPLTKDAYLCLFSYFAIVNPIVEEFFWRGTIYAGLRRKRWPIFACSLVDAILFGSWHWLIVRLFFPPPIAFLITIGIIGVGALFCRFYEKTRSLPAVILLHALGADVPVLLVLWCAVLSRT